MDVAAAGAANATMYATRAAELLLRHPQLSGLAALLAGSMPSTNVDGGKIAIFDGAGAVLDARSIWTARSGGDRAKGVAAFERSQKTWLARRAGFEALWEHGEAFVYGAANPGHAGAGGRYGAFCLVVRPARVAGPHSAVFPGNTAALYGRESGPADGAAARAEAGCWPFVDDIGLAVFGDEAAAIASSDWPMLACNEHRFLEVVTAGPIALSDVVEVRISTEHHADLNRWSALDRRGRLTDPEHQNAVAGWRIVRRWVNRTRPHIALRIL